MDYIVYILQSEKTKSYYIGYTSDLVKRLRHHNGGSSGFTKKGIPWNIVYTEQYSTKREAWLRERQLKSYKSGEAFRRLLSK